MKLAINHTFLIGCHTEGVVSVINPEAETATIIDSPFGEMDSIWNVQIVPNRAEGEPEQTLMATTNGLYIAIVTEEGQFMYCMESFFKGSNVTNCVIITVDEVLCSIQKEQENRLVIVNLETQTELTIINAENAVYYIDMAKIPHNEGDPAYYLMHSGRGISMLDSEKKTEYQLALNNQFNFNVCRSLSLQPVDSSDCDQGFWLAQIDNGMESAADKMHIQAYKFKPEFMQGLRNLHLKAATLTAADF